MSRKSENTRARILCATCDLLAEGAGERTRMSDVAKAAGISRQALYLHYTNRAELLIAAARYLDEINDIDAKLAASRAAMGSDRLDAYIAAWGRYLPIIYQTARALMAMRRSDAAAAAAWDDRMAAMRHGCAAAVRALATSGELRASYSQEVATDLLFTLLSVPAWEGLVIEGDWHEETWIPRTTLAARHLLVRENGGADAPPG